MLNTLLFIHLIIAILLIIVILLQKTSTDGLSGIGGGGGNMGLMSGVSAASFLMKTTIIFGICFFVNALVLANLSSRSHVSIIEKMHELEQEEANQNSESTVPMAR